MTIFFLKRPPNRNVRRFGAYDKGPMESRVRYTDAVARTAEFLGWSWAYWQFDSDFILWDMKQDKWVEPILHALIPAKNVSTSRLSCLDAMPSLLAFYYQLRRT